MGTASIHVLHAQIPRAAAFMHFQLSRSSRVKYFMSLHVPPTHRAADSMHFLRLLCPCFSGVFWGAVSMHFYLLLHTWGISFYAFVVVAKLFGADLLCIFRCVCTHGFLAVMELSGQIFYAISHALPHGATASTDCLRLRSFGRQIVYAFSRAFAYTGNSFYVFLFVAQVLWANILCISTCICKHRATASMHFLQSGSFLGSSFEACFTAAEPAGEHLRCIFPSHGE